MAFQLAPRTSSVCSQSPYSNFLPLSGFAPAVAFCTYFEANGKLPSTSSCPNGNSLCKVLSSLSSCEVSVITQACICIGVTTSTTVSVPKTTSQSSPIKSSATTWAATTSSSKSTNSWTPAKSSSSTWQTSTLGQATNTCSASTVTVTAPAVTVTAPAVTVTVTPSICLPSTTTSPAASSTPTCVDGAQPVQPPPDGAICQQNGTLNPTNWDLISGGLSTSVSGCAAVCLNDPGCQVSEYDYETQNCQVFTGGNATELGFVPVAASVFIVSDGECFVTC